jgi:hypothetical protein
MMSCRISLEIELGEFLADPRAEAFADFRAHYPRCPECAAEVRVWTELQERLAAAHPEPERLARYPRLAAEERAAIDRHTAGCPSCREEISQLASFDPRSLGAAAPGARRRTGLREALGGLGHLLWHPAFAYALAAALLVPALQRGGPPDLRSPGVEPSPIAALDEAPAESAPPRDLAPQERARPEVAEPSFAAGDALVRQAAAPPEPARLEKKSAPQAASRLEQKAAPKAISADAAGERRSSFRAPRADAELAEADLAEAELSKAEPAEAMPSKEVLSMAAPARAPSGAVLHLALGRRVETSLPGAGDLELRVTLPESAPGSGEAELRLVDASERRELRERLPLPSGVAGGPPELLLRVPGSWLAPGSYRLELVLPGVAGPLHYSFAVGGG